MNGPITTPAQLAEVVERDEKTVRAWLREEYPAQAPGQGYRWVLTASMVNRIKERSRLAERR
jgi:hypothetical protein